MKGNWLAVVIGLVVLGVLVAGLVVTFQARLQVEVARFEAQREEWGARRDEARAWAVEAREDERTERTRIRTGLVAEVLATLERIWSQIYAAFERSWLGVLVVGVAYGALKTGLGLERRGRALPAGRTSSGTYGGRPTGDYGPALGVLRTPREDGAAGAPAGSATPTALQHACGEVNGDG